MHSGIPIFELSIFRTFQLLETIFFTPLAKMLAEIYTRYLEPISVPLGGSNNRDSTVDLQVSNLQTPPPSHPPLI